MGRKPNPIGKKSDLVLFKIPDVTVLDKLDEIARREGMKIKEVYSAAFKEYLSRHYEPGNSTPKLDSFAEGGAKSPAQVELECINKFRNAYDLRRGDLMQFFGDKGFTPKECVYSVGVTIRKLHEIGKEVLQ